MNEWKFTKSSMVNLNLDIIMAIDFLDEKDSLQYCSSKEWLEIIEMDEVR